MGYLSETSLNFPFFFRKCLSNKSIFFLGRGRERENYKHSQIHCICTSRINFPMILVVWRWFQINIFHHLLGGNDPIQLIFFSDGLKSPPSLYTFIDFIDTSWHSFRKSSNLSDENYQPTDQKKVDLWGEDRWPNNPNRQCSALVEKNQLFRRQGEFWRFGHCPLFTNLAPFGGHGFRGGFLALSKRHTNNWKKPKSSRLVTSVDLLLGGIPSCLFRGNLERILSSCEFFAVLFSEVFGVTSKGKRISLPYWWLWIGCFVWLLSGTYTGWNFNLILVTCGELVVIPLFL